MRKKEKVRGGEIKKQGGERTKMMLGEKRNI